MKGSLVLGLENATIGGDKHKLDKTTKAFNGNEARKKLADISNLRQQHKPSIQEVKSQFMAATTKEYIDQLKKENMSLMNMLAERNKIVELSGIELQKLSVNLQKMQHQNLQLAQSNSQMLAELNSGKDKLKALHHELGCKNGLLKAKELVVKSSSSQEKEKAKTKACPKTANEVEATEGEPAQESTEADRDDYEPCTTKRTRQSKSLGPSTVKQVQAKEKAENKRLCMRRQSARFKPPEESKPTENFFETDEAKLPVCSSDGDQMQEESSDTLSSLVKKEEYDPSSGTINEQQVFGRSSVARPLRQAAKKVQSYKETPLNVKMRRDE